MTVRIDCFLDISKDCIVSKFPGLKVWEEFANNLPELSEKGILRPLIWGLPKLDLNRIKEDSGALQRTYTIFTFIAHSYIRGRSDEEIITRLPESISSVWIETARLLGVPPISTYSSTVLFNCFRTGKTFKRPEDFEIRFTFTGTEDEKWFYAVSAAIDSLSRDIISIISEIAENGADSDLDEIGFRLAAIIDEMTRVLNRMYEKCRPEVFYNRIRRYFSGWFNDPNFEETGGLIYELPDGSVVLNLAGGSAAQNPTVQLLDILLDVKHSDEPEYATLCNWDAPLNCCPVIGGGGDRASYLLAMRKYMPREHRQYLSEIAKRPLDRQAAFKRTAGYAEAIKALTNFRSEHIKMVTGYVVCQNSRAMGTGGSNPIPFLKKLRDDTIDCICTNKK